MIATAQAKGQPYPVVAAFYEDGASCAGHAYPTSPEHAANVAQLKV